MQPQINETIVRKLLTVVDAGLVKGVGKPKQGQMCVEAAVCYALGLDHGDDPQCVSRALRSLEIRLNDSNWSSDAARAKGLRRLAVAQLGSRDTLDDKEFAKRVVKLAIQTSLPVALRAAASVQKDEKHKAALYEAADRCEKEGNRAAAQHAKTIAYAAAYAAAAYAAAAYAAAAAAYAAAAYAAAAAADAAAAYAYAYADAAGARAKARDKVLGDFAEGVVQILIEMNAPGCQWLPLTETPDAR